MAGGFCRLLTFNMGKKRKVLLTVVLAIVIAAHILLFTMGGNWRTLGLILVVVDVISALFIVGAIREFRKLDEKQ